MTSEIVAVLCLRFCRRIYGLCIIDFTVSRLPLMAKLPAKLVWTWFQLVSYEARLNSD